MNPYFIVGILAVLGVAFIFLGIFYLLKNLFSSSPNNASPKTVQKAERICPYCGNRVPVWYIPDKDSYPVYFKCGECFREFGDFSKMSADQKQRIEEINADCLRAENEFHFIKQSVLNCTKNNGWITFQNGDVYYHGGGLDKTLINLYAGLTTEAGVQHLAILCLNYCRTQYPGMSVTFQLMNYGFSWEW